MYIIIAGAGMVGGELARYLMEKKHDVVIIDANKESCDRIFADIGVVAIKGSAARIETLKEAQIHKADVMVAATVNDADNLACSIMAKSFGVQQIIVRMRDPAYENAYKVAGVNTVVRVTDLMVNQLIMEIEKPEVHKITSIGHGQADIFVVTVPDHSQVIGRTIQEIVSSNNFPSQCVFIAIYNNQSEEFSIPRGQQIINQGDELFLISSTEDIKAAGDYLTAKTAR